MRRYYGRFGFSAASTGGLWMPGRYERERLLALELKPGALAGARGLIAATGKTAPKPDLEHPPRRRGRRFARLRAARRLIAFKQRLELE